MIEQVFVDHYRDLLGQSAPMHAGFEKEFLSLMPMLEEDVRGNLGAPISVCDLEKAIDESSPG